MDEKKPRGFAAMTPEARAAAIEKGRIKRAENKAARLASGNQTVTTSAGKEELKKAISDPEKTHQTLDRMRYTKDPREAAIWGANPDISPLHVPDEIKAKYPEFEFKWCSTRKIDKTGGTGPWQIFEDAEFSKDGKVRRSDDTILAVMPRDLKEENIDKPKRDRAMGAIRGLEESRVGEMEQRAAQARAGGDANAAVLYGQQMESGRIAGAGILIGRQNVRRRAERLREQYSERIKSQEIEKKYFDMGKR